MQATAWSKTDITKGRYVNFARLVLDLGVWRSWEAFEGAVCASQKCIHMASPWVRIHPQTELVEFLILQFEWAEEFKTS